MMKPSCERLSMRSMRARRARRSSEEDSPQLSFRFAGWDGCRSFVIGLFGECLGAAIMTGASYGLVGGLVRFWTGVIVLGSHDITQRTA